MGTGEIILSKRTSNRKSDDKKVEYIFDYLFPATILWIELASFPLV